MVSDDGMMVEGEVRDIPRRLTPANVVRDIGDRAALRAMGDLEATTIRMRAPGGLDVLAYLASGKALTAALDLDEALEQNSRESLQAPWLAAYGRAKALLAPPEANGKPGVVALRTAFEMDPASLHRRHALTLAWAVARAGDLGGLARLMTAPCLHAQDAAAISAEVAKAIAAEDPSEEAQILWLHSLSRFLPSHRLPFRLPAARQARFDDISSLQADTVPNGPLISVVTPVYRPTSALVTSVLSVLHQSWQNLELLVVDDGSDGVGGEYLEMIEQLDERVRIVRTVSNEGTYRARNRALNLARGEFVTGQDADDWSHPQRLERQVRPLLGDPSLVATVSRSLRMQEDLSLLYRGYPVTRTNASSLMFRRVPVQGRLGFYDSVRKSADSEFEGRLRAVFGSSSVAVIDEVLAFVRLVDSSLSRGDFSPGWHHERRVYYRTMYERWHERVRRGKTTPFIALEQESRPFPAPRSLAIRQSSKRYDVVLLGDWRKFGGPQKSMLEEIAALKDAGLSVAIAHKEAMRFMVSGQRPLCDPIMSSIEAGMVDWIQWDDDVEVGLVILRYPPILHFADSQRTSWRVRCLWILANQAPMELDGSDQRYVPMTCERQAELWFDCDALWVPQGPAIRSALRPYVAPDRLAPFDSPGIIDPDPWRCRRPSLRGRRPVVGRHSRDEPIKFPGSSEELLATYDMGFARVRMMGARKSVPQILGEEPIPANWELLPHGAEDPKDFLGGLDFFVYYHDRRMVEAFGRAILEAAASGCLVVLDPRFQEVFGDAAVYADSREAPALVERLASSQADYDRLVGCAATWVDAGFSHDSFVRLVTLALLDHGWKFGRAATPNGPLHRPAAPSTARARP